MTIAADSLSSFMRLPAGLLFTAGLALVPVAGFIVFVASRATVPAAGGWLVVVGNAAWALTSLALLTESRLTPNALGIAFIVIQAAAVAILAELEFTCLKRIPRAT